MKKLLVPFVISFQLSCAMDLNPEAIASASRHAPKPAAAAALPAAHQLVEEKEKKRVPISESSSSASHESDSSSSSDKMKMLNQKIILRTLELDAQTIALLKERLAKYELDKPARVEEAKEVTAEDKKKNRLSLVYMPALPKLDLLQQKKDEDLEQGVNVVKLTKHDYESMVDHYAKETGRDFSQIKGKMVEVLKKKVETPPTTPDNAHKAHAIITYRKASMVQAVAHTDLETARKMSPINRAVVKNEESIEPRGPTIAEIIEHELGGNAGDILKSIASAADEAFNQKLTDAKSTQQKTAGGGALGTLLGAVVSGIVTYAVTKNKC